MSKSKKKAASKRQKESQIKADMLKDLDRFAGSSEEENGGSDVDTDDESLVSTNEEKLQTEKKPGKESKQLRRSKALADGGEADASSNENDDDDSSSDEDEYGISSLNSSLVRDDESDGKERRLLPKMNGLESSGMAGAMAKILGLSEQKSSSTVILSKTTTPLQKLQQKEKAQAAALQSKQKIRREVNLTAMHVPLSAATSKSLVMKNSNGKNGLRLAKEIEVESMHRRVATRGVVALFNTIAKHQQEKAQQVRQHGEKNTSFFTLYLILSNIW